MGAFVDLTRQRFGRLLVTRRVANKGGQVMWECQCECGNTTITNTQRLRDGRTKSCGCLKAAINQQRLFVDMTGQRFGRLQVLNFAGWHIDGNDTRHALWRCKCDCGAECDVKGVSLRQKSTQSCGCYRDELRRKVKKDLIGQRFGNLIVVKRDVNQRLQIMWKCLCDCGNKCSANTTGLIKGTIKSCGCLYAKRKRTFDDLTGRRFRRLQVVEFAGYNRQKDGRHRPTWTCICDCGKELNVLSNALKSDSTQSCGCYSMSLNITRRDPVLGPDDIPYELARARMDCAKIKRKLKEHQRKDA